NANGFEAFNSVLNDGSQAYIEAFALASHDNNAYASAHGVEQFARGTSFAGNYVANNDGLILANATARSALTQRSTHTSVTHSGSVTRTRTHTSVHGGNATA